MTRRLRAGAAAGGRRAGAPGAPTRAGQGPRGAVPGRAWGLRPGPPSGRPPTAEGTTPTRAETGGALRPGSVEEFNSRF